MTFPEVHIAHAKLAWDLLCNFYIKHDTYLPIQILVPQAPIVYCIERQIPYGERH